MKKIMSSLALAFFLMLAAPAFADNHANNHSTHSHHSAGHHYAIDPTHTQARFKYSHFGFSNIEGRFDQITGDIIFDPENIQNSSVSVTIEIASVSTGVEKLDEHLLGADFFNDEEHPKATFTSHHVEPRGANTFDIHGMLTLNGVKKPVILSTKINKVGEHPMKKTPAVGFDAQATIRRSDFNLGAYAPAVSDEVILSITVEATAKK